MAEQWKTEWSDESYEWPEVEPPTMEETERTGNRAVALGGRQLKEAHADRSQAIQMPSKSIQGGTLRKRVNRSECRRRAQVTVPQESGDPLKACIVCDSAHLWPAMQ